MDLEVTIGTYDGTILGLSCDILNSFTLKPKFSESSHLGMVTALDSYHGILATGSSDETIKLYNMKDHTELGILMLHEGTISALEFFQKKLISCSVDGLVCVWSTSTWDCVHVLKGHRGEVCHIAVHSTGKLLLSVGKDKTIRTWDLILGKQAYKKDLTNIPHVVKWSPVGDQYLIGYRGSVVLHDVETGQVNMEIDIGHAAPINCVIFLQDSVIAVGCESPDILIYSILNGGQLIANLQGHRARVKQLCFVAGIEALFSVSSNGTVKVWKTNKDNMSSSECVSEAQLPYRLTCMTVVYPHELTTAITTTTDEVKEVASENNKNVKSEEKTDDNAQKRHKKGTIGHSKLCNNSKRKKLLLKQKLAKKISRKRTDIRS